MAKHIINAPLYNYINFGGIFMRIQTEGVIKDHAFFIAKGS